MPAYKRCPICNGWPKSNSSFTFNHYEFDNLECLEKYKKEYNKKRRLNYLKNKREIINNRILYLENNKGE